MTLRTSECPTVLLALSFGVAACSGEHTAILSAAPPSPAEQPHAIYARSAPPGLDGGMGSSPPKAWKLADNQGPIEAFTVVDGQAFWLARGCDGCGSGRTAFGSDFTSYLTLRSCSTSNCADSVAEWRVGSEHNDCCGTADYVMVNDTRVFWPDYAAGAFISTCPRGDCASPRPLGFGDAAFGFAVDEARAYFVAGSTVARCELEDCAGTVSRYEMKHPPGESPVAAAFSLSLDADYVYLWDHRILRVAKEGSDTFEVLAHADQLYNLVVHGDAMFWTTAAGVYTCPKSGCVGEPREIVAGLSAPSDLAVDDRYAYFVENRPVANGSSQYATISRCSLDGSDEPELLIDGDQGPRGHIVVDDEYLYFSGTACEPQRSANDHEAVEACDYVAVIRK